MQNLISKVKSFIKKLTEFIGQRPLTSFLVVLAIFVGLLAASNAINKPKVDENKQVKPPIEVQTFHLGESPTIQVQAQAKTEGSITIEAQTAGIVQQVYKKDGETVSKGTQIIWISSSYNGGTISSVQKQLAQSAYDNTKSSFQLNKGAISNQRDLANRNRENSEELRKITESSLSDTKNILNLNNELLRNIDQQINNLQNNTSRTPDQETQLATLKSQKAQLASSETQLNASIRANQYQADPANQPTAMANIQKDLTLKQLDVQDKALELQLESSRLNYVLAQISESFNYPSAPFAGTIEHIHVTPGQSVNPGEPLITLTNSQIQTSVESFLPQQVAKQVSMTTPSTLYIEDKPIEIMPSYIPKQPTNGSLYAIKYQVPSEYASQIANNSYLKLEIPIGISTTSGSAPFVPLDSIYQTQDGAYVYTVDNTSQGQTIAKTKKIELGEVIGNYVEVRTGLSKEDNIILDRNILEGDQIKIK